MYNHTNNFVATQQEPVLSMRHHCDAIRYQKRLGEFTKAAWPHAGEPNAFESNWHIDCINDHLMAVARRDIKGPGPLIFTMPPRFMKSRGVNVFFPAWVWAQNPDPDNKGHGLKVQPGTLMGPGVKFAYVSYKQDLSNEHSAGCRALIQGPWYQEYWGDRVTLASSPIDYLKNNCGGDRRAMSFGGAGLTGFGADIIVIDDAHDTQGVESDVMREKVLDAWRVTLPSRLNDRRTGIYIVIMQRSHERDLIGDMMAREFDGMHVCLPAWHERQHPHVFSLAKTPSQWRVPRETDSSGNAEDGQGPQIGEPWHDFRKEGEVLWKSRFPEEELKKLASTMPAHAVAGQYQQRPTAREGGLFKREWFKTVRMIPESATRFMVRAWDLAASADGTKSDPDWTAGVLMARDPETKMFFICDVVRQRWSAAQLQRGLLTTAHQDSREVKIRIPQDPGGAGKFQAFQLGTLLAGFTVNAEREDASTGGKDRRADPLAAQFELGAVRLYEADWNQDFVEEFCAFPRGAHDDQVDAATAAFRALTKRNRMVFGTVSWGIRPNKYMV